MHTQKNRKEQIRIESEFYRILLTSEKSAQTIALVPDALIAHELTQLLARHVKVREDQYFHCKLCKLRPETHAANEPSLVWDARDEA